LTPAAFLEQAKDALRSSLRERRPELEAQVVARVHGIADLGEAGDAEYREGVRTAVAAALEFGQLAIESDSETVPEIPAVLLVQARLAARKRVSLDTVMRRYNGGNTLFAEMLIEEAGRRELPAEELTRLFRVLSTSFERLLAAVADEYHREAEAMQSRSESGRVSLIERLLEGEVLRSEELAYEIADNHLALVASGTEAIERLRVLAGELDRRILIAEPCREVVWAWFGGKRGFGADELERLGRARWPEGVAVGCGEPGAGFWGWRMSHRQAAAALPAARQLGETFIRYGGVALLAAAMKVELLDSSLRELYLAPLSAMRDGGVRAKETLRAYFGAAGNSSSAAIALGVSRRTIATRMAAIEALLGRPVEEISAELETVLQLDRLQQD
jgi:peptidyl-tRNA hydrolase